MKKVVYISGPITGVDRYWEAFEKAEEELQAAGFIPLSPAHLPRGMEYDKYMFIDIAALSVADAALFLPGWYNSRGAIFEREYCRTAEKPYFYTVRELKEASEDGRI